MTPRRSISSPTASTPADPVNDASGAPNRTVRRGDFPTLRRARSFLSGSPSALLRPGPLRTGRATFTASGSIKPQRASVLLALDPLPRLAVGVDEACGLIVAVGLAHDEGGLA